jgi:hypothetical protein
MNVQFLLFVIAILLVLIFWELGKINSRLKKTLTEKKQDYEGAKKDPAGHQQAHKHQEP